jgi:glycosyltransferase involved in cell wall biosynthesis
MGHGLRVSIVSVNLNQGAYLEQAMRSVLEQDYPELEYIVVDGGSTDESLNIIQKYAARLAYWTSEPDRGQSHAINKGLARATGEVVGWLNADDFYLPGALSRVAESFSLDPGVGLVYGSCVILDEASGSRTHWQGVRAPGLGPLLTDRNGIPQPSAFVRRSILEKTGPLDESMHLAMDYDLWLRIYKYAMAYFIDQPLSVVRDHPNTKTRRLASGFVGEFVRAVDRFYAGPDVPSEAWAYRRRAYARLYYAAAETAALTDRQPRTAAQLFWHAVRYDPRLLARVPRALAKVFDYTRQQSR